MTDQAKAPAATAAAREPERTPDGRYIIVGGRRWRATDPEIPETFRAELVAELMTARRLVRTDGDAVRHRVHDAKVALGERGHPWWEDGPPDALRDRLAATACALLRNRAPSTICPSDVARTVGGTGWRSLMDESRAVATELQHSGHLLITQKGEPVDLATVRGPIRLAPGARLHEPRTEGN